MSQYSENRSGRAEPTSAGHYEDGDEGVVAGLGRAAPRSRLELVLPPAHEEPRAAHQGTEVALAEYADDARVGSRVPLLLPFQSRRSALAQRLFEGAGWTAMRLGCDLLAGVVAVLVTMLVTSEATPGWLWAFPLVAGLTAATKGLYAPRMREVVLDAIGPLVAVVSVATMLLLGFGVVTRPEPDVTVPIAALWLFAVVLMCGARAALGLAKRRARRELYVGKPTLIVGAGDVGSRVAERLRAQPEYGLRPIGFVDADPPGTEHDDGVMSILGSPADLHRLVAETGVEHVILAFAHASDRSFLPLVRECDELGVEVSLVPRLFESITDRVALERLGALPLLGLRAIDPKSWQFSLKYALDRAVAAVVIALISPLLVLLAIAVRLSSQGPILYRQPRVGLDGREFEMLKFRTMRGDARRDGEADAGWAAAALGVSHDERAAPKVADRRTALGRLMRKTSLDELPQFLNVLRGDMSLVGPRPERTGYARAFEDRIPRYGDRHRVKSGITGWAQVHGLRGQTSLVDRIEWDNFYIENWSLWLDVKVLVMTLSAVVRNSAEG